MTRKPHPEETLRALERLVDEDDEPALEAKSDAELDAELAAAGFDPEAERAFAEELASRIVASRGTGAESVHAATDHDHDPDHDHDHDPDRDRDHDHDRDRDHDHDPDPDRVAWRSPRWLDYSLAASIAALFGTGVLSAAGVLTTEVVGHANDGAEGAQAQHLRAEAAALAKEEHWKESLEKLDEAQKVDPAGNDDEAVQRVRRLDEEELGSPLRPDEAPHEGRK